MKRVYVAGAYSSDNVIGVLNNIRKGTQASVDVFLAGFAPFCPWLDYQFQFYTDQLKVSDYYSYSMAWLDASDAVLVTPDYENSKGTIAEIERAMELHIPVYFSLADLIQSEM
ncbi:MAG: DUF4406 domain-containing protein [Candidatus Omnitrophota bacterium]